MVIGWVSVAVGAVDVVVAAVVWCVAASTRSIAPVLGNTTSIGTRSIAPPRESPMRPRVAFAQFSVMP